MSRVEITFRHFLPSEAVCDLADATFCQLKLAGEARCRVVLDHDGAWVHARVELSARACVVGEADAREPERAMRKAFARAAQRMRRQDERQLQA